MIPFYGDVDQFITAVKSVLWQTDPDWKLVIVDDRYPDERPRDFVRGLGDPRIEYVLNNSNLGISGNFQKCISLAKSEFTTIMGCDDILLPNYVERLNHLITLHPTVDYIQPGVAVIDDQGQRTMPLADKIKALIRARHPSYAVLTGEELAESLLRGNWTYFPSLCWKTSVLRKFGFRQEYRIVLDLALQLEIIIAGGSLLVDNEVVFEYRRHAHSASSWAANDGSRFAEEAALFAEASQRMAEKGWMFAQRVARRHMTSRLNALTKIPAAILARDSLGTKMLVHHAFGK